jgi:hypothetical protein
MRMAMVVVVGIVMVTVEGEEWQEQQDRWAMEEQWGVGLMTAERRSPLPTPLPRV